MAINGATLSDRRGVNLPNASVNLPAVSEKDKADITFGCKNGIDVIFASFIRTAAQVQEIKDLLKVLDGRSLTSNLRLPKLPIGNAHCPSHPI